MVGNELPAPRTAPRSEAPAFAALLDHRAAASSDAAASDNPRDRSTDARDDARPTTWNTTGIERPHSQNVAERPTRHSVEASHAGKSQTSLETAGADAPEAIPDSTSTETESAASAGADGEAAAADHVGVTDESAQVNETEVAVATLPMPAAPLPADIALLVAPGLVPQNFSPLGTVSQNSSILPEIQAGQNASAATEPTGAPVLPQLGDDGGAIVPAAETTTGDTPIAAPTATGKTFSETLFAATMLAQTGAADDGIVLPAEFQPQAATVTRSLTAATSPARSMAEELSLDSMPTLDRTPKSVPATPSAPQHAGLQTSQQAAQLSTLLDLQNVGIDITQTGEPASGKPLPPLANGMAAQINLLQQGDRQTAPSAPAAPALGAPDSLSAAGNTPTQTVTAIAAPPVAQAVADEPRAKVAPDQSGIVLNAPAPAGGVHTGPSTAVDHASPAKFTVPAQPATDQVAVHIAKAAAEGADKINIKLKPLTLGQIEVQLDVASDGRVHAVIAADKPETLDLLQRDARALERALNDAGLRTDSGSLSFNLRGQNQQFGGMPGNANSGGGFGSAADRAAPDMELLGNAGRIGAYLNSRAAAGGVDIQV